MIGLGSDKYTGRLMPVKGSTTANLVHMDWSTHAIYLLTNHKRMICKGKPVQKVDPGNWVLGLQIAQDEKH